MAANSMELPAAYVPWLETAGAVLLVLAGHALGRWCSRLPGRWWSIGYFLPLSCVLLLGVPSWFPRLYFVPPTSWLTAGRTEYVIAGILVAWLLTTPLSRLPRPETRRLVVIFMVLIALSSSVMAFLSPAVVRSRQMALKTQITADGVCLQSNDYNCGPASAVTALRRLGLPAEEGTLAVLAHTSPFIGTPPDVLARILETAYQDAGLKAKYRFFERVGELKGAGEILAVVKYGLLVDHYVAVLEVGETTIKIGDPLSGSVTLSHEEFLRRWRKCAVVITRGQP